MCGARAAKIIDGTISHWSDDFSGGPRISVVALLHTSTPALPPADIAYLQSLGFALPAAVDARAATAAAPMKVGITKARETRRR